MTQEDKYLLLKDLCARLPYGANVNYRGSIVNLSEYVRSVKFSDCKPYLRPMSSMTEEEKKWFRTFYDEFEPDDYWKPGHYAKYIGIDLIDEYVDWLNAHHFDYRGLIEKGLALEAPEGMYKKKGE